MQQAIFDKGGLRKPEAGRGGSGDHGGSMVVGLAVDMRLVLRVLGRRVVVVSRGGVSRWCRLGGSWRWWGWRWLQWCHEERSGASG